MKYNFFSQKNFNKADLMLVFAFLLFVLAIVLKLYYPSYTLATSLFLFTAEASLVGGIADWFAVTALFRKPLGFSYHTALIPKNREKLISTLTTAIENDFLSKTIILEKLKETKLIDLVQNSFSSKKAALLYKKSFEVISNNLILILEPDRISRYLEILLKKHFKKEPLAPHIYKLSNWLIQTGKITVFYDFILKELIIFTGKSETKNKTYNYLLKIQEEKVGDGIFANLAALLMEQIGVIKLDEAASTLQNEVLRFLYEAEKKDSLVRIWFEKKMSEIVIELANNENWISAIESWKNGFLKRLNLLPFLNSLIIIFQNEINLSKNKEQKYLFTLILKGFETYIDNFNEDIETKEKVEEYLQNLFKEFIENNHYLLGRIVTESLVKMSNEDLSTFVSEKTSDDLEWIRINGVFIGGIIGLILGLLLNFIYDPYILPFLLEKIF